MNTAAVPPRADDTLTQEWGSALSAAHCGNCGATFLIPAPTGAPECPNCLAARLAPQPALDGDGAFAPPELVVPFAVPDATLHANLERWLRAIPFRPASLNVRALRARLARVFIPMYLADASVWGTWQAQMGFDYLVASSEERFDGKTWVSQRINETRVRWESRAGDISRRYQNISAPALEQHARLLGGLGAGQPDELPFDTLRAIPYAADALNAAFVRVPDVAPNAAWHFARQELERRAARDCETAANAQHHEQFVLRAAFGEPAWTLLLLPLYVARYADDDGKWLPVRVNGQTGFVNGEKRASMKRARGWTILIGLAAVASFLFAVGLGIAGALNDAFVLPALVVLLFTFLLCLAAPAPLIVAWRFNRQREEIK